MGAAERAVGAAEAAAAVGGLGEAWAGAVQSLQDSTSGQCSKINASGAAAL